MVTEIPWPVERHSYLPDPSLAHAFTHVHIFCEGSGHQTISTSALRMHAEVDNEEGGTILPYVKYAEWDYA